MFASFAVCLILLVFLPQLLLTSPQLRAHLAFCGLPILRDEFYREVVATKTKAGSQQVGSFFDILLLSNLLFILAETHLLCTLIYIIIFFMHLFIVNLFYLFIDFYLHYL